MLPNLVTPIRILQLPALATTIPSGPKLVGDGQLARRRNLTPRLGAMIDLLAGRLPTLLSLDGLIATSALSAFRA